MVDKVVTGSAMGRILCELCGVDARNVMEITVRAGVRDTAEVTIRGIVRSKDGKPNIKDGMIEEFRARYSLIEVSRDG